MTIGSGTRLGLFELIGLIGAGRMGVVYRAYDPRLQREVAIKVLPPALAGDAGRLRRFEQEALAVARLAHPNIVAVHDVGSHEGSPYLVMELLDGATLGALMKGQPLPVRRAVDYATQIASGLAAAHEQGIVHRDIKPENLFVTRDGRVKILDFGIAKLTDMETAGAPGAGLTAEETAATLTVQGLGPLGTPAYMSPEQARGARADARADLFSLGVVLYEMLSGISPFRRETAPETMTAILRDEPPPFAASLACPPELERIVSHCLQKSPENRFQAARDVVFALGSPSAGASPTPLSRGRRAVSRSGMALLATAAVAMVGAGAFMIGRRAGAIPGAAGITAVHRLSDFSGLEEYPAIARDFRSIAFTARAGGIRQIFVRLLAGGPPLQITKDAADHQMPRWSRDGSSMVYFSPGAPGEAQGTIWQIPALGGAPRRVIESIGGGDINAAGRVAAFRLDAGKIELVSAAPDQADVRTIVRFDERVYFKCPRWSPDGNWIAYQRGDGFRWDIFIVSARGGTPRQITNDNGQIYGLAWLPDGSGLVYSSGRSATMPYLPTLGLWEVSLQDGRPRRLAASDQSYLYPDVHDGGTLAASRLQLHFDVWQYPVDGSPDENVERAMRLTRQTGQVQTPTAGTKGSEVAFLSDSGGHANLWVSSGDTGELRQITYERDPNVALGVPNWSPDGRWIAFVSSRGNTGLGFGMWVVRPDGGDLRNVARHGLGASWSHDARWLYYADRGSIYKVPAEGGTPVAVRSGSVRNVVGFDGTTLYYMVDRTLADGTPGFELHAATPEDAPSRILARIPPSRAPQWQIINPSLSPDGRWLAMPLTDGVTTNIWTLSTSTGEWRRITDFGDRATFIARRVSWAPDGRSILAAVGEGDADVVVFETGLGGAAGGAR